MNILIRAAGVGDIDLSPTLPPALHPLQLSESQSYGAMGPYGSILLQFLEAEGVSVYFYSINMAASEGLLFLSDEPAIRLQIALRNSYYFESSFLGTKEIHERGFHLHYAPAVHTMLRMRAGESYSHITVHYDISHLVQLTNSFPRLIPFIEKIGRNEPVFYSPAYSIANARLLSLVDYLLHSQYKGHLQRMYIGMLAKDLLLEALLRNEEAGQQRPFNIAETEVKKIYHAKDILLRDLHLPFSLPKLAVETGLSTFRLNREFKGIYGMGPKEYLVEARMRRAIRILSETDISINAVARDSGYATSQSFSIAFKNYFGCTPGSVHRRGKESGNHDIRPEFIF